MATRPSTDDFLSADGVRAADGPTSRHQLTVLAASMADVVEQAGGWIFDRARAGWDVSVRVEACHDQRPLEILGATAVDEAAETVLRDAPPWAALAVSAQLLCDDPRVRAHLVDIARTGGVEVVVWGEDWPAQLGGRVDAARHRLSVAARAFKARALVAAELTPGASATETLYDLRAAVLRPLSSV